MSRRISQSITPTTDDVTVLREPFAAKGANDPVIAELRRVLKAIVPTWLAKLTEEQELTSGRLEEIKAAVTMRRQIIEALPDGKARSDALDALTKTEKTVADMDTELSSVSTFGG
ncbi:hypothetical protein [Rhodococcus koreensis]|uniref:hypothetical protein n=1 Tax=Rhodococcus koreensis TaxID=99653 RepID=UPI00366EA02B